MTEASELPKRGSNGDSQSDLSLEGQRDIRRITATGARETAHSNSSGGSSPSRTWRATRTPTRTLAGGGALRGGDPNPARLLEDERRSAERSENDVRLDPPRARPSRNRAGLYTVREDCPRDGVLDTLEGHVRPRSYSTRLVGSKSPKLTDVSPNDSSMTCRRRARYLTSPEKTTWDREWIFAYFDELPDFPCDADGDPYRSRKRDRHRPWQYESAVPR